ncbi:MAG: HypC/HybG/HupF family hydrogenase formation chaperone [Enhygromyxa sp.]
MGNTAACEGHPNSEATLMCLALPGELLERWLGAGDVPFGRVAFAGVQREVCLAYTPEAEVGAFVIVHVGFAIQVLDEQAARAALALWQDIEELS